MSDVSQRVLADQNARDRIVNDLDTTLLIEAAAGTGKTTALVSRIVATVASGRTTLDRVVAVTFTEKAAGELKLRLRSEIEKGRLDSQSTRRSRELLQGALPHLEQARIGTIHSFCGDLLRERPVEAGVDPLFEVAPQDVADRLLARAFDRWFERALAQPGPGLRRILSRRQFDDQNGPRATLCRAARELASWRDFDAPWPHESFDRDSEIDALINEIRDTGKLAAVGDPHAYLTRSFATLERFAHEATRLEAVRGRDYDGLESQLIGMLKGRGSNHWNWKGRGEMFGKLPRTEVLRRRESLHAHLEQFSASAQAELAPLLREELWPVVETYQQLKHRSGLLDFMDLLLLVRNLIRDNSHVRTELQQRFSHVFIDEFQDTDPLQAEILLLLSADDAVESDYTRVRPVAGKLFIVGDPKQSIYRFRRADVSLYQGIKRQLLDRGAALEHLTVSFRAVPELQRLANAAFAPIMIESPTQAGYAPLCAFREEISRQPSIIVLPVPAPYGDFGTVVDWKIEESQPDAVGAFVEWLVKRSGWKVTEREKAETPVDIEARHVCLLFRRFNDFGQGVARPYVRALEARHVPHVLVKGTSFHEREEVEALRNAMQAIERPDDELKVFAVLKGPLFAISDGALLAFRETFGSLHPFRKLPEQLAPELAEVSCALEILRKLHRGRNRRPIADTISRLLNETRAHAGFAMWPTGEQALANLVRFMDEARRYEARPEGTSFRGFIEQLEAEAESGEAAEAPVVEEGTEGVRIMTVHSAKGLEFPVVILADITCNETRKEAQRLVDPERKLCLLRLAGCSPRELLERNDVERRRDQEEAERLLYVATTRARDLLVIPAVGDNVPVDQPDATSKGPRWLDKLTPVIFPPNENRRAPTSRHLPDGTEFGDDSVLVRPDNAPGKAKSVAPGFHWPMNGEHAVLWWDPFQLKLDAQDTMGLRQMKLLAADESKKFSQAGIAAHQRWQTRRQEILARGAAPSTRIITATELVATEKPEEASALVNAAIEIERMEQAANRPHGKRFGTLVHLLMLSAPFDAERALISRLAAFHARMLGCLEVEVSAAIDAVLAALKSNTIAMARAAGARCRRECAALVNLEDGTLVEGIADLAFQGTNGSGWTVVDFKTDVEIAGRLEEYRAQLGLYMRAIEQSTSLPVKGILLWI